MLVTTARMTYLHEHYPDDDALAKYTHDRMLALWDSLSQKEEVRGISYKDFPLSEDYIPSMRRTTKRGRDTIELDMDSDAEFDEAFLEQPASQQRHNSLFSEDDSLSENGVTDGNKDRPVEVNDETDEEDDTVEPHADPDKEPATDNPEDTDNIDTIDES